MEQLNKESHPKVSYIEDIKKKFSSVGRANK